MKRIIKFVLGLIISGSAFSAEPVEGIYFSLLGELSHASNIQLGVTLDQPYTGQISLSPVGAGFGASLGYKISTFRLEGEFLFNMNNYSQMQIGSCTLISPDLVGPQGICPLFIAENGLGFKGNAMGFYGLFNVLYDFLSYDSDTNFDPYIGIGVGAALIRNNAQIQNNEFVDNGHTPISISNTVSNTNAALQGIIGLGYYIDDFTTLAIDFRYISTVNFTSTSGSSTSSNSSFGISTLNLTGTFALDKGA